MGDPGTIAPAPMQDWPQAWLADARGDQRHLLRAARRLPVADVTPALPAASNHLCLVRQLPRRRHLQTANHHLLMLHRERVGCEAAPSAAVMDGQNVKTTEAG